MHSMPSIDTIKATIPNSDKFASIDLYGKNLIITGVNGCGKTQFIEMLYSYIYNTIIHGFITLDGLETAPVSINNSNQYRTDIHQNKAVLLKFDATRQAKIGLSTSSRSLQSLLDESRSIADASTIFEHYLVSQKTMQAYADSPLIDNKPLEAQRISEWFVKLDNDFQSLFEDDSLYLKFNSSSQSFTINQHGKLPFSFQQLSSGFSSIISIYADLLTRIRLTETSPGDFYGIVFIDEIDAHLHVSLQRKILSFLTTSFPKIQFIVTTHSPFVVSSVDDAIIYDLSSLQHVEDLSMYSYDSIISGLFNTIPISKILQDKVLKLTSLIKTRPIDVKGIESLVLDIGEHEDKLDEESSFFLKAAKIILSKATAGGDGV